MPNPVGSRTKSMSSGGHSKCRKPELWERESSGRVSGVPPTHMVNELDGTIDRRKLTCRAGSPS